MEKTLPFWRHSLAIARKWLRLGARSRIAQPIRLQLLKAICVHWVAVDRLGNDDVFRVSVKCGPDGGGWLMADRKMRMIKCGWKIAGDARYIKSIYALSSRSIVWSLLCYCVRNRDHCCVLCDVARDLLLTWYIVTSQNSNDKMQMEKWGWKIANDTMQMIKSLWGQINLRCFLKVLFVNKLKHLIELRSGEVQYLIFNPKQVKTF